MNTTTNTTRKNLFLNLLNKFKDKKIYTFNSISVFIEVLNKIDYLLLLNDSYKHFKNISFIIDNNEIDYKNFISLKDKEKEKIKYFFIKFI